MIRLRIRIGRDAIVVGEDDHGIEIESTARLAPGRDVEIVTSPGPDRQPRCAIVDSWQIARLDTPGPTYRGYCKWL
jgi:hypothetical protein